VAVFLSPCIKPIVALYTDDVYAGHLLSASLTTGIIGLYGFLTLQDTTAVCTDMQSSGLFVWSYIAVVINLLIFIVNGCCGLGLVAFGDNDGLGLVGMETGTSGGNGVNGAEAQRLVSV